MKAGALLDTLADWVVWGGLAASALVLVYILIGVFTGQLHEVPAADMARVTQNMRTATDVMLIGGALACLILVIRQKEDTQELYAMIALAGLVLWFGFPFVLTLVRDTGGQYNEALRVVVEKFSLIGQALLATLVWPLLVGIVRSLKGSPLKRLQDELVGQSKLRREKPKAARARTRPTAISPCWHLPYCRDYLLDVCPAFKARKRCWKFGRGCFCDNSMIESMMTGVRGSKQKPNAAYLQSEIQARTGVLGQRAGQKPPCKRCFIYLEHQKLKYEALHPLMYPTAAAVIYFAYEPFIKPFWLNVQAFLTNLWGRIAFSPETATPASMQEIMGMETVTIMFAVLLGMWLLLGLLRIVEIWCFKWKL